MVENKLDHVRLGTLLALGLFVASYLATTSVLWASGFLSRGSSLMFYYEELIAVAAAVFLMLAADCASSSERERLRVVVGIGAMGLGACAMGSLALPPGARALLRGPGALRADRRLREEREAQEVALMEG